VRHQEFFHLISCNLTKLETALDQIRKARPKMKPADAARLASALVLTGRHAVALYDGAQFRWPDDVEKLTRAMVGQIEMVQEGIDETTPKRGSKTAPEEEPVVVTVGLAPNLSAGEENLEGRDDLKTALSDIIQEGVEYNYSPSDIGWQWALDRTNWNTLTGKEISKRVKIKASFTEGAVGIEIGSTPKKRASRAKAAPAPAPEPEPEPEQEPAAAASE
jgi:hypothetical protein